jgi:hypothetical protein
MRGIAMALTALGVATMRVGTWPAMQISLLRRRAQTLEGGHEPTVVASPAGAMKGGLPVRLGHFGEETDTSAARPSLEAAEREFTLGPFHQESDLRGRLPPGKY